MRAKILILNVVTVIQKCQNAKTQLKVRCQQILEIQKRLEFKNGIQKCPDAKNPELQSRSSNLDFKFVAKFQAISFLSLKIGITKQGFEF
jgi:hypothetical protein